MRTIKELRDQTAGKIFIYLCDEQTKADFVKEATVEGYKFGNTAPEHADVGKIVSLDYDGLLHHVGYVGTMAFYNGGEDIHRVDYKKYIAGEDDYAFKKPEREVVTKNYSFTTTRNVIIIGDNAEKASEYLSAQIRQTDKDHLNITDIVSEAEKMFDVIIVDD